MKDPLICPMCGGEGRIYDITDAVEAARGDGTIVLVAPIDPRADALRQLGSLNYVYGDVGDSCSEPLVSLARVRAILESDKRS